MNYGGQPAIRQATVAATPAAISLELGFVPSIVMVTNLTTGAKALWTNLDDDASAYVESAGASGSGGVGAKAIDGISRLDEDNMAQGIKLGTLTDFNDTADEVLQFICFPSAQSS